MQDAPHAKKHDETCAYVAAVASDQQPVVPDGAQQGGVLVPKFVLVMREPVLVPIVPLKLDKVISRRAGAGMGRHSLTRLGESFPVASRVPSLPRGETI